VGFTVKRIPHTIDKIIRNLNTAEQLIALCKTLLMFAEASKCPSRLPPLEEAVLQHLSKKD